MSTVSSVYTTCENDKTALFDWLYCAASMGPADSLDPIGKLDDIPVPDGRDVAICFYSVRSSRPRTVGIVAKALAVTVFVRINC